MIGVGNETCGDDAAGILVARSVEQELIPAVACLVAPADALSLLGAWDKVPLVVVVDAARSGAAPGTIHAFDARLAPLPALLRPISSHGYGILEVIELARVLGRLPPRLLVFGIEGTRFAPGDPVTAPVAAAVLAVTRRVALECAIGTRLAE